MIIILNSWLILYCQNYRKDKFIKVFLPDGQVITAELAVSPQERERGLMFRKELAPDQGMLFIFEEEDIYSFWMKNTLIPLDIIWLNSQRQIVHLEKDVPPCPGEPCPTYSPGCAAKYVLELKAGQAEAHQLKLFDRISFVLPDWVKKAD
ncbi:MAG TPA: DUF192 domain-containing protein [Candidatus Aminicenantes bacterium]|nr:MAG: hypothetical protein C0168_08285 [Candidatus Aminicenantes bacterium]HEK85944.1 DUF192 domain-containing protein [Candidatus Aminicenantes bacterium]